MRLESGFAAGVALKKQKNKTKQNKTKKKQKKRKVNESSPFTMGGHSKKAVVCKPEIEPS